MTREKLIRLVRGDDRCDFRLSKKSPKSNRPYKSSWSLSLFIRELILKTSARLATAALVMIPALAPMQSVEDHCGQGGVNGSPLR